jgi:superfamily II DNA helicase RecQ
VSANQKSYGGNYDRKLFAKLRKLRKSIADEENIPPYVVFNDATLLEMAEQMPIKRRRSVQRQRRWYSVSWSVLAKPRLWR